MTSPEPTQCEEHPLRTRSVPPRRLWLLAAGFGIWCSALVILYALHAISCAFAWPTGTLRLVLGLILLGHVAALGWLWRSYAKAGPEPGLGSTGEFLHWVVLWTFIAAFVSTLFTFGPPLLLTACV